MPRFPWILKEVGLEIRIGSSKSSRKSEKKENGRIFAHRNPNFLFFLSSSVALQQESRSSKEKTKEPLALKRRDEKKVEIFK